MEDVTCNKLVTTKNVWQSLANSLLSAAVSPPSKKLRNEPSYHLENVQRMQVVSVCLHYGTIIWLPWQRPLTNWK